MTSRSERARSRYLWRAGTARNNSEQTLRILIFHGYLLRGTGSNIYNASLVRAFARLGHEVELVCQERSREELDLPDGRARDRAGHRRACCRSTWPTATRASRPCPTRSSTTSGWSATSRPTSRAVREVVERTAPDVALANHLVMGPVILARALGGDVPYAVKVHGSALEYTVRPNRERFLPYALEGLRGAAGRAGGLAAHRREPLGGRWTSRGCRERTRLGPPGVDVHTLPPAAAGGGRRRARPAWPGGSGRGRRGRGAERRRPPPRCARSTRRATGS